MGKLVLEIDESVIKKAESYAKQHRKNLATIVSNFLASLPEVDDIADEVKSLPKGIKIPKNTDYKKAKADYLTKKYLS